MAVYLTNDTDLKKVADAIREKGNTTELLAYPDGFVTAIGNITTGSGTFAATITVTCGAQAAGATVAASIGSNKVSTVVGANGKAVLHVGETGTYTVAVISGGFTLKQTTVVVTEGTTEYEVSFAPASGTHIYGVDWPGTSATSMTRTDDSADFASPVPYIAGASTYGSPFDNLYPWSGMTVVEDATAGTLVKIPKFWYKLTASGDGGVKIQIADAETTGFHVSPAHMDRGDGKGERDVVYIGRYHCGSNYKSATGVAPKASITRATARSGIHALGDTIWQSDFAITFTIWLLYTVEMADWNSQTKIGYGCGNGSSAQTMGYTDEMPYHTGTTLSSRTFYGLGTQYRHIEGLWDNVWDWMDGCFYNSNGMNLLLNPTDFTDNINSMKAVTLGTLGTASGDNFIKKWAIKELPGTFPLFIPSDRTGSGTTYVPDRWSFDASYPCLYRGGGFYQTPRYGLFCVGYDSASLSYSYVGCRLQKLP